jgi:ferrous iron transport protein A
MTTTEALSSLNLLDSGERARVELVVGAPEDVHRLEELGFRTGSEVEMVRAGTPCIVRLGNSQFCLRHAEVFHVLVSRNG